MRRSAGTSSKGDLQRLGEKGHERIPSFAELGELCHETRIRHDFLRQGSHGDEVFSLQLFHQRVFGIEAPRGSARNHSRLLFFARSLRKAKVIFVKYTPDFFPTLPLPTLSMELDLIPPSGLGSPKR